MYPILVTQLVQLWLLKKSSHDQTVVIQKKLRLPYMHKSRKKYKESKRATMGSIRKGTNQA
jgi:hypothetical protein